MIYIILIVLIIIVIIYLRYEHLETDIITNDNANNESNKTNEDALNNIVTMINDNNTSFKNLTVTNNLSVNNSINSSAIGSELKNVIAKEMSEIFYPVGSVFISRKYYNLNNKSSLINTPLNYGSWLFIDDYGVLGTAKSNYSPNDTSINTNSFGDAKIKVNHIPPHKHKYQWNPGRKSKYNSNYEYSWTPRDALTEADIYDTDGNKVSQVDFNPYGYYMFVYRKISL